MMFSKNILSDRLREARGTRTQAQAAGIVGLSQQGWARYESGKVMPGAEAIHQICVGFNVSADWLLGLPERGGSAASVTAPNNSGAIAVGKHARATVGANGHADCATCKYKRLADAVKALQTPD